MRIFSTIILVCACLLANAQMKLYYCNDDFEVEVTKSTEFPIVTCSISLGFLLLGDDTINVHAEITDDVVSGEESKEETTIDSLKKELLEKISSEYNLVAVNSEQMEELRAKLQNEEDYYGVNYNYEWKNKIIKYNDYFYYSVYSEVIDADEVWWTEGVEIYDTKTNRRLEYDNIFSPVGELLMLHEMTIGFEDWLSSYIENPVILSSFIACIKQNHFTFDVSAIENIYYNEDGIVVSCLSAIYHDGMNYPFIEYLSSLCDNSGNQKCNICPIEDYLHLCTACNYEVSFGVEESLRFLWHDSPVYKYYLSKSKH